MPNDHEIKTAQAKSIHDAYRTALLNCYYYQRKVNRFQRINICTDIFIALGTSAAIAGWNFWQTTVGNTAWSIIGGLVVVCSLVRPFFHVPKRIEKSSKLQYGHKELFYDLKGIESDIDTTKHIAPKMIERWKASQERHKKLSLEDDEPPDKKLILKLQDEVDTEIDAKGLWYPEAPNSKEKELSNETQS